MNVEELIESTECLRELTRVREELKGVMEVLKVTRTTGPCPAMRRMFGTINDAIASEATRVAEGMEDM